MEPKSAIGLIGLGVMGQNLSLNIASKGFPISVYNRTYARTEECLKRAAQENVPAVRGYATMKEFADSLSVPRAVIILVQAGAPVDQTIAGLIGVLEKGDLIIDGGNEWYENTERRASVLAGHGFHYMGMGVSGGEHGARYGPSLMPGGPIEAYRVVQPVLEKIAAQVNDGPCVTYIGAGGSGNYVKMVHNGIEYGDMQLIAEAYDILKNVGKLSNDELAAVFDQWNKGKLQSFLIEITAQIFKKKDSLTTGYLVDAILDKTGSKGTGKMTVRDAAERSVAAPTIAAALDTRFISSLKEDRVHASSILKCVSVPTNSISKADLIEHVGQALYASKICSYAQGMNLIRAAGAENKWSLNLGEIARIWKGGCIIRAIFLDRINVAYTRNPSLPSLLIDPDFADELNQRQQAWRTIVQMSISSGISIPAFAASLSYFDAYRRERLPANLTQAQRDFFGAHTFQRVDRPGDFHCPDWASSN